MYNNDIQHNSVQHKVLIYYIHIDDSQYKRHYAIVFSVFMLNGTLFIVILNVTILGVILLNVIILNVVRSKNG
jgi:hypothetical protein